MTVTGTFTKPALTVAPATSGTRRKRWRYLPYYLAISPFFILFAIFGAYPIVYSLYLALQRWDGIGAKQFVGLDNFVFLFTDTTFWTSILNTLVIWVMSTIPMTIIAILIALGLNSSIRFKGLYRVAYFIPNVTSVVAASLVFSSIFSGEFGILNWLLGLVGLDPVQWLATPWGIKTAVSVMIIWRWVGYNAIIFLAGLQAIPAEVYEAAKVDGAGPFRTFFAVTLPLLRPVLLFSVVLSAISGMQIFTESQVLVGNRGGPGEAGLTMVLYFYNEAFFSNNFGYGAAISWGIFLVVVVFAIINWRLVQRPRRAELKGVSR